MRKWISELIFGLMLIATDLHWKYLGKKRFETEYRAKLITNTRNQDSWKQLFPSKR